MPSEIKNWKRFKTFIYKYSFPYDGGSYAGSACVDVDTALNAAELILLKDVKNNRCTVCKYKRDTDINGNHMNNEIFCTKSARCESLDYGCNRFEK